MNTDQKAGDVKRTLPVLITPQYVELKILTEVSKNKLSFPDLEKRSLEVVRNEDGLKEMAAILEGLDSIEKIAEKVFKIEKQPHWDNGKACDDGKKLVFTKTSLIRTSFKADYDRILKVVADKTAKAAQKEMTDKAIVKGIEDNVITFSKLVVGAITKKQLLDVERRINIEKSPSMQNKYGEFHAQAIARYDLVLLPIIKAQKIKVDELEKLNDQLREAEANNDPDKMDELIGKVNEISNEMLQNHSVVQEAALNQETFAVFAPEILPGFKVKRTNYTMEIADVEVAFKKARPLLEFSINKDAAKLVLERLKKEDAFEDTDEVILDGIKYIATKVREAL